MLPSDVICTEYRGEERIWVAWIPGTGSRFATAKTEAKAIGKLWQMYAAEIIARMQHAH